MYNIFGQYLTGDQKAELIAQIALNAKTRKVAQVVVMDNLDLLNQLKPFVEETICRDYRVSADSAYKRHNVQTLIDHAAPACTNGHTFYIDNEPKRDESGWKNCFNWLTEVAEAFGSRGWKCVLGNWSIGMPDKNDWLTAEGQRFIRTCSKYSRFCRIGLHEYFPSFWGYELSNGQYYDLAPISKWVQLSRLTFQTHYVGRFVNLFAVFDIMKLPGASWPKISITEFGTDRIDDAKERQQHLPGFSMDHYGLLDHEEVYSRWSEGQGKWVYYYKSLAKAYEVFYRPYEHLLTGVSTFCYGSEGIWARYDIAKTNARKSFDIDPFRKGKAVTPVATIKLGFYRVPDGVTSHVRDVPGGSSIALVSSGAIVEVDQAELRNTEKHEWAHIITDEGKAGWIALLTPDERIQYVGAIDPTPVPVVGKLTAEQKAKLEDLRKAETTAKSAHDVARSRLLDYIIELTLL